MCSGVGVETLNLENEELDDILSSLKRCKGFVIGSPTLGGHMPTQAGFTAGSFEKTCSKPCMTCQELSVGLPPCCCCMPWVLARLSLTLTDVCFRHCFNIQPCLAPA